MNTDVLIVGAGFAGLVVAERLANEFGLTSLIVERRGHIGGNSADEYDSAGVLVHKYGPHYFRTNAISVREYLSQFTEWHPVEYKIKSFTDGRYWSFPINLNTFEELLGRASTTEEMEQWLEDHRIPIEKPANSEEVIISKVGEILYEKFFRGYTIKQWQRHPRDLDPSVCARIPVRTNRDDRYLREEFQALPRLGYSHMFQRMFQSCGNRVRLLLNCDYREVMPLVKYRHLVYTGPVDEFFDFSEGRLPYRSLRFENESFSEDQLRPREEFVGKRGFWQPYMQVNYPNSEDFTRIVEIKHATGQVCANTTIVREYSQNYLPGMEPYYPVPAPDSSAIYARYKERAALLQNVSFVGRLATYRYYNMDQVVAAAVGEARRVGVAVKVNPSLGGGS